MHKKSLRSRDALASIRDGCAPRNEPDWTILHNKLPPTPRVGLVRPPSTALHRPALILLFAKKFFRSPRRTNEVNRTNILAPGFAFFPPSPPEFFGDWPNGKSYPVTAAQLLPSLTGFLAPIHFSKLAKNWCEEYRLALSASRLFNGLKTVKWRLSAAAAPWHRA